MLALNEIIQRILRLREEGRARITLLAACPNSAAVLEAAVLTAARNNLPMLFAATLNQVDRDGGYTGWTPAQFVAEMQQYAAKYAWDGPLYPCLDHGGPWLKDAHTRQRLPLAAVMAEVKESLSACLRAGYQLLHIDPTVDRTLPPGASVPIEMVVERTIELIAYAEAEREQLGLPPIAYEVGTEEVHGGLVDMDNFTHFVTSLARGLAERNLDHAWPCFIVGKVGTDLHTSFFDPDTARQLYEIVAPSGSLIKGHYTDWVENPADYPASGMGGANVGPEFTAEEYLALADLVAKEEALCRSRAGITPSNFLAALEGAVYASNRWQKWLQPEEAGVEFADLSVQRRSWLVQTGARYVWTDPGVAAARQRLYTNLHPLLPHPNSYVVDRIARSMDRYVNAFGLFDSNRLLENGEW
ncbi:MAG: class II D-tagatose-bisphosphate aldolase, non-catalytic subunit [Caldilineaceae bacterium]|nr:class II D-tagatose-bisphosphate aldolase, non-catalytic subunit [Caldilineaceae bacterium]